MKRKVQIEYGRQLLQDKNSAELSAALASLEQHISLGRKTQLQCHATEIVRIRDNMDARLAKRRTKNNG